MPDIIPELDRWYPPDSDEGRTYHQQPGWSSSMLPRVRRSMGHAFVARPRTRALDVGCAVHALTLEGREEYERCYAVQPHVDARTKEGKRIRAEFREANRDKVWLKAEEAIDIEGMAASVWAHPIASQYLRWAQIEHSMWYRDERTGLICKLRTDATDPSAHIDLKSTEDASAEAFRREIYKYSYHVRAAHYMAGALRDRFVYIAVEKSPPYAVNMFELSEHDLALGWEVRDRLLDRIKRYEESGFAPFYTAEIKQISLPRWAVQQDQRWLGREEI